jgi:hypothetical protein
MEPSKIETPVETRGEGQTAPPRQPERKRRFQIIKLEERIAPGSRHGNGSNFTCGGGHGLTCEGNCVTG